jgi:ATP-dependent DNA helicase MPH1
MIMALNQVKTITFNTDLSDVYIGHKQSMAWLIDDDDEPDIEIVDSSIASRRHRPAGPATDEDSVEFIRPSGSLSKSSNRLSLSKLNNSIEAAISPKAASPRTKMKGHVNLCIPIDSGSEHIEIISDSNPSDNNMASSAMHSSTLHPPCRKIGDPSRTPPSPTMQHQDPVEQPESEQDAPHPSFPVRPVIKRPKRRHVEQDEGSSPILDMPPPSQRRLHRRRKPSPVQQASRKQINSRFNPLFDVAALHSGDETSEGSSHPEDDIEDESDRLFLQQMPETQLSPSYDQTLAYRQSLFTQAPAGSKAPLFANRPVRHGMFRNGNTHSRRGRFVSSSPSYSEPDEYAFGSFVVDDKEISYLSSE